MTEVTLTNKTLDLSAAARIAKVGDAVDRLHFTLPKMYDGRDLTIAHWKLVYQLPDSSGAMPDLDITVTETAIEATYELKGSIVSKAGKVDILLTAVDAENEIVYQSDVGSITVAKTLIPSNLAPEVTLWQEYLILYDARLAGAQSAQAAAEAAKLIATTKAAEALASANLAGEKATEASGSAATAGTHAGTATTKAAEALASQQIATTKAAEALASANLAGEKATEASGSAATAGTHAGTATTKAAEALASQQIATTKAAEALASANLAGEKATEASGSAATAGTHAGTATTKAAEALASQQIATAKAAEALASATTLSNSLAQIAENTERITDNQKQSVLKDLQHDETDAQITSRLIALSAQVLSATNMYALSRIHKIGAGFKVSDNSANDESSIRVDGDFDITAKGMTATNLVANGDFSAGTTGWAATNSTLGVSGDVLSVTGNGTALNPRVYKAINTTTSPIYIRLRIRVTNALCTRIWIYWSDVTSGGIFSQINPVENQWYEVSVLSNMVDANSNNQIYFSQDYADAATANGKVMQIDGDYGVMAINLTASGIQAYIAAQCASLFPNYFTGTKSTLPLLYEAIGKNLFDKSKATRGIYVDKNNGITYGNSIYTCSTYIPVMPSTNYYQNYASGSGTAEIAFYDSNKVFISGVVWSSYYVCLTPANCRYVRTTLQTIHIDVFQFELGTTNTTHEAFKSSRATQPVQLHSVPAIPDSFNPKTGRHVKNVKEYVLQASDITGYTTTGVNIDYVALKKPIDYIYYNNTTTFSGLANIVIPNFTLGVYDDNILKIGIAFNGSTVSIGLIVANGTYADLAAAQAALAGSVIRYQLATPSITYYPPQLLTAGVHLSQTLFFQEVLITNADGQIFLDYELSTIKRITLVEGGEGDDNPTYTTQDTQTIDFTGKGADLIAIVEYEILNSTGLGARLEYYTPISNQSTRLAALEARKSTLIANAASETLLTQFNALLTAMKAAGLMATS